MTVGRTVVSRFNLGDLLTLPVVTYQRDEHTRQGVWSKPNVPLLIFSDNTVGGATLQYSNGPIAGAAGGSPLQLIFWGAWWTTQTGAQRRTLIEQRAQSLLASPYFTELVQYGVVHAPVWRGSTIVTKPAPPTRLKSTDTTRSVLDLVDDLLDDGVFPDPDDGPRFAFIVLMPDGFTVIDSKILGAHKSDYDWDFPFDTDRYWAGWVRPEPTDPEETMRTLGHELVEILTDPESDAWRWNPVIGSNTEIADTCFSDGGSTWQVAFVNGVMVQSYWSNRHGAMVIPIDNDYEARLTAKISESSRNVIAEGTFRPDASDSAACSPELPECCIQDRDYQWRLYSIAETAQVRVQTHRYRTPAMTWTINGTAVSGVGDLPLTVNVDGFIGRTPISTTKSFKVHFEVKPNGIDISAAGVDGNFEILVGCSVTDGSITGNLTTNVIATPKLVVDFVGAEVLLEDAYIKQRSNCLTAMVKRYAVKYKPTGKPGPGDPINFLTQLNELPSHVRPNEYHQIREAAKAMRAAYATLPAALADSFGRSLTVEIPTLERQLRRMDQKKEIS